MQARRRGRLTSWHPGPAGPPVRGGPFFGRRSIRKPPCVIGFSPRSWGMETGTTGASYVRREPKTLGVTRGQTARLPNLSATPARWGHAPPRFRSSGRGRAPARAANSPTSRRPWASAAPIRRPPPVSPSLSWDVRTMRIFIVGLLSSCHTVRDAFTHSIASYRSDRLAQRSERCPE